MKKTLIVFSLFVVAAVFAVSCSAKKQAEESSAAPKALVLYYSQSGTTKAVADKIAELTGADIEAVDVEKPYDGTYNETIARCMQERGEGTLPKANALKANLADYEIIYLGYPIWFGTHALPINSLVEDQDFAGKTIVPFCTFGSGGLEVSVADLKQELPKATICDGYGVRTARIAAVPFEVERFLKENGYIEGEVEALADYSEPVAVTDAEIAIFDAACSSYQFPLGTPVAVGSRTTPWSTDYKFQVKSVGMDGTESSSVILVTVANGENATPEFTKVVR